MQCIYVVSFCMHIFGSVGDYRKCSPPCMIMTRVLVLVSLDLHFLYDLSSSVLVCFETCCFVYYIYSCISKFMN